MYTGKKKEMRNMPIKGSPHQSIPMAMEGARRRSSASTIRTKKITATTGALLQRMTMLYGSSHAGGVTQVPCAKLLSARDSTVPASELERMQASFDKMLQDMQSVPSNLAYDALDNLSATDLPRAVADARKRVKKPAASPSRRRGC